MSMATDYLEKKIVDHVLGKAAYTMPGTTYLALFTANPTDTGSQAGEVSAGGYARQAISTAMGASDATTGTSSNTSAITFGPATAAWGTVTYVGIMDASTAGNMLVAIPLTTSRTINNGDSFQFAVGQLTLTQA